MRRNEEMIRLMKYIAFIAIALLAGCKQQHYVTFSGLEQGTTYTIVVKNPGKGMEQRIDEVFNRMDNTFSMFNPESLVSRINSNQTELTTPLFDACFAIAKQVHTHTGGYFDLTVKPLVDMWGFGPGEEQEIPCVECVMEYVGMDKIRIEDGRIIKNDLRIQLDFSSIAKGFTVDKLAEMLESDKITDYMVYVGGEVRVKGVNESGERWRIGINKPTEGFANEWGEVVAFDGKMTSIATSGNYRNWFIDETGRRRVHTIDPITGLPAIGNILSVSIVGADCVWADAYATGLMASRDIDNATAMLPPEGYEYLIIYSTETGKVGALHSPEFPLQER